MSDSRIKCRQARSDAALWAGGDLDAEGMLQLERHLAVCPDCRRYRDDLCTTQNVLRAAGELPGVLNSDSFRSDSGADGVNEKNSLEGLTVDGRTRGVLRKSTGKRSTGKTKNTSRVRRASTGVDEISGDSGSLWPAISSRLDARDRAMRAPRFNGWAPFLAVTAACTLIAIVTSRSNFNEHSPSGYQTRGFGGLQVPVDDWTRPAPRPILGPTRDPGRGQPVQDPEIDKERSIWQLFEHQNTQIELNTVRPMKRR
jgi:hypothetical protein